MNFPVAAIPSVS